jgi:hypothetical protein
VRWESGTRPALGVALGLRHTGDEPGSFTGRASPTVGDRPSELVASEPPAPLTEQHWAMLGVELNRTGEKHWKSWEQTGSLAALMRAGTRTGVYQTGCRSTGRVSWVPNSERRWGDTGISTGSELDRTGHKRFGRSWEQALGKALSSARRATGTSAGSEWNSAGSSSTGTALGRPLGPALGPELLALASTGRSAGSCTGSSAGHQRRRAGNRTGRRTRSFTGDALGTALATH